MTSHTETEINFNDLHQQLDFSTLLEDKKSILLFNRLVEIKAFKLIYELMKFDGRCRLEIHDEENNIHLKRYSLALNFSVYDGPPAFFRPMDEQETLAEITTVLRNAVYYAMRNYLKQLGEPSDD